MIPASLTPLLRAAVLVLGFGGYLWGVATDPRMSAAERQRETFLRQTLAQEGTDIEQQRAEAEAYWRRYPDVAADPIFGPTGPLGLQGPREHYQRHGRHEGRVWPTVR